ncbi:MAG: tetratricopeptide repeat protein, partial [Sphingobacteriia bacterium]
MAHPMPLRMKKNIQLIVYTGLIMFLPFVLKGQGTAEKYVDSLKQALQKAPNDSVQYSTLHRMYSYYEEKQKDSALAIAQEMYKLSSRNNQQLSKIINLGMMGYQQMGLGDYSSSLKNLLKALEWSESTTVKQKNTWSIESGTRATTFPKGTEAKVVESQINHILGNLLFNTGNLQQAKPFFRKARNIGKETGYIFRLGMASMNLGRCLLIENKLDSALNLLQVSDSIAQISPSSRYLAHINTYLGDISQKKGDQKKASQYYHLAIYNGIKSQNFNGLAQAYIAVSQFFLLNKNSDSCIFYAQKCLEVIQDLGKSFSLIYVNKGNVYQNIYESYLMAHQKDSAAKYRIIALEQKDSINKVRIKTLIDFQQTLFENQLRLQKLEKDKIVGENRNRTTLFVAGIVLVAVVSLLLYRNNRIKAKDNVILQNTLNE